MPRTLFQPTTLEDCPNWRYLVAHQLAHEADAQLPLHPDPWIQDTAELLYVVRHKVPDFQGTWRQRHIRDALLLPQKGALIIQVLECRLAGEESLADVASKCTIDKNTLEAYSAVICDLSSQVRSQAWAGRQMNPLKLASGHAGLLARLLLNALLFGAVEGLDAAIDVVCGLDGPTLADGLPLQSSPEFPQEFDIRSGLAQALLPHNKKNFELVSRFEEVRNVAGEATSMSLESIDLGLQILRRATITQALQREISQLRVFCGASSRCSGRNQVAEPSAGGRT